MAEGEGGYSVGSAFLQILPSFKGIAASIEAEAAKWGRSAGAKFGDTFNDEVKRRTNNAPLGPDDSDSTKQGTKSGGKFADGFKAKVRAALASLPDIQIGAATTEAEQKLRDLHVQLEELSKKTIGVDIDEGDALAELDRIKTELDELGAKSPSIRVKADTAAASAKLAELQAEIEALQADGDVEVDASDGGSAEQTASGVGLLVGAILTLLPLLGPLAGGLAAVGAGVGATLGAVAGAAGVAYLGLSGVSKAVGLLGQQQKAATATGGGVVGSLNAQADAAAQLTRAEAALKNARAQAADEAITSAEQVKQARQSLDDTLSSAFEQEIADRQKVKQAIRDVATAAQQAAAQQIADARDVVNAEHNLAQAAQSSANAQQQLNDAREQAARDLESYADNAVDSNLNLQQSRIDLTNAQSQYQSDLADPSVTPLQLQQDALNVAKAQQAIVEAQQRLTQATEDNNKAQAAGVDGAPAVISAQQGLAAALYAQQQAAQALGDAQTKQAQDAAAGDAAINKAEAALAAARLTRAQNEIARAEQIAAAEQKVTDALRAQANQKRQSAYSISSAQGAVAGAKRAVAGAGTAGGGGAASTVGAQLAATNPAVLKFAEFIKGKLEPALNSLKATAAKNLLPGLQKGLTLLLPVLPSLTRFVGSLASVMGNLFVQAVKALGDPVWQRFFGYVARSAGPILTTLAGIIGNLAKAFAGFMTAFGPITRAIGQAILRWAQSLTGQQGLGKFVDFVKRSGPIIAQMLGSWFTVIGHLIVALAPLGTVMATVLGAIGTALSKLSSTQLLAAIGGVAAAVVALGLVIGFIPVSITAIVVAVIAACGIIVANWSKIQPVVQPVLDLFKAIWGFIVNTLVPVLVGIFKQALSGVMIAFHLVSDAVSSHRAQLGELVDAFKVVVGFIVTKVLPLLGPVLKAAFIAAGAATAWLIDGVAAIVDFFNKDLIPAGKAVGKWFAGPFVNFWKDAAKGVKSAFGDVADFLSGVWHDVESVFVAGVNFITQDILNPLIRVLNGALGIFGVHIGTIGKISASASDRVASAHGAHGRQAGYSTGGTVPGYAPGSDSVHALLSPGEGVLVPEAVRGIGGAGGVHALNAFYSSRVPRFALGGVLGGIGNVLGGAAGAVGGAAKKAAEAALNAARQALAAAAMSTLHLLERPILAAIGAGPSQFARTLAHGLFDSINSGAESFISGHKSDLHPKSYDNGGWLPTGMSGVWNGTGAPEPVFTSAQAAQLVGGGKDAAALLSEVRRLNDLLAPVPDLGRAAVQGLRDANEVHGLVGELLR